MINKNYKQPKNKENEIVAIREIDEKRGQRKID